MEEGLHQLLQEGVRDRELRREAVGGVGLGVGHARREKAVGDGLGIHIREAAGVEIVDQRPLEGLHQLCDGAVFGLDGKDGADPFTDLPRKLRQLHGESLRGLDNLVRS